MSTSRSIRPGLRSTRTSRSIERPLGPVTFTSRSITWAPAIEAPTTRTIPALQKVFMTQIPHDPSSESIARPPSRRGTRGMWRGIVARVPIFEKGKIPSG